MRTATRFGLVIIILALVLGGIFGWRFFQLNKMMEQLSQPQPPAVVEATEARSLSWTPALKSVGSTRAINGIQVANELPGVVTEIAFESGQRVSEGDVLLRLDSSIDQANLETRQAEAQLARQEFERLSDLLPRRAISQAQFDEAEANLQTARARVNEAEAQLNKKTIRAPFGGALGLRLVDLGEYLPAGTPTVELNELDPMYVDYTASEQELASLSVGNTVELAVAAAPTIRFQGQVSAINSSVSPETRTVRVRATVANPDNTLLPGMFATVRTLRPQDRELVAVPRTAVSYNTYGDFVFVISENDEDELIAERRSVETGEVREGMVEILDNLEPGELVVKTGLLRLRAGQQVQVQEEDATGQEPAGQPDDETPANVGEAAS